MEEERRGGRIAIVVLIIVIVVIVLLVSGVRILREYERGVIFRLGRLIAQKGPGLIYLIPIVDRMVRIDLRTVTLTVPPQEVITKDNVTVRVTAVAYFRVIDPNKAVTEVENFLLATSQIGQTTLRSVLGKAELDALLSERERLNVELQQIIDEQTEPWGVKVTTVEVKDVELPADMQRAIARQAEAERERRAKIISADGEFQAAEKLSQAANIISLNPATLQLRYLQTLLDIGVEPELDDHLPAAARHDQAVPRLRQRRLPDLRAPRPGGGGPGSRSVSASQVAVSSPEVRIDQLTGLRAILAPGRADRPDAFAPAPWRTKEDARASCPFCEGREDRTPPEVWARRPGGGEPDSPGWTARAVPNLYPVLAPAAHDAESGRLAPDAARPVETGLASSIDPLGSSTRAGEPDLFASQPGRRRPRGDRPLARARDLVDRARRGGASRAPWTRGASGCGPDADEAAYVHLIVNEGPDAGASLEHSHAQLYAMRFVPAEIARERERAAAYHQRTMGGDLLVRRGDGGGAPQGAAGRDRRRGGAGLPVGVAIPVRAPGDPAAPGAQLPR